jgi:hypothetical protein
LELHYLIGNALEPVKRPAVIPHICNDIGCWGSGFVVAISRKYLEPERQYRKWGVSLADKYPLGDIQTIQVEEDLWICNMIAQHDTRMIDGIPPLRLEALKWCLESVNDVAIIRGATIHAPRIGAVRSGGKWGDIEKVIKSTLTVDTYIYTLEVEKDMWDDKYESIPLKD